MTLIERLEAGKPEEQEALLRDWLRAIMPPAKPGEWTQEQWSEWLNLTTRIERLFDCGAYLDAVMLLVPEGWFVYGIGEQVKPIIFKGDTHDHIAFWSELQRRQGGLLQKATASTPALALAAAILKAKEVQP